MSEPAPYKIVDFGAWVKSQLDAAGVSQSALSQTCGIVYPSLNRILNSGSKGTPIKPDNDTIERISAALVELNVIEDVRQGWVAAGYLVDGYKIIRGNGGEYTGASELTREPVLDEVRQAGYSPDMPEETRQEILDYIRYKAQKAKGE